ncbi:HAMP domain-containing histidine kinase [Pseudanabaenaceae cyanobacterium LEGE 13415]|nr:HAMP domain-containing histidine kinase [Pseudanabaenaceae cyanobacterium LEGE 13415]
MTIGKQSPNLARSLILFLFAIVIILEFATPSDYVFGYLYIGAILIASSRLSRIATFQITVIASLLTLANLWIPIGESVSPPTIANRIIAVIALIVTGILGDRNRLYQMALLQQQSRLRSQEQLSRLREDFVSTLTHDLKTPLLGAIETLNSLDRLEFGTITSAQKTVFNVMKRSHETTLKMVEMLLDVYRNDAEGLQLNLEPVNLANLAEEILLMLRELATNRRVYLSVRYGNSEFRQDLWVNGDRLQLQRVFTNLVTNSINHSPRGERVSIVLESSSSYQTVKVIDSGMGIPADALPHLFERFYQGQSDRQATGSGLGLYLSRQIIEAHHGTIWAENLTPQGAMFAFRLAAIPPERAS